LSEAKPNASDLLGFASLNPTYGCHATWRSTGISPTPVRAPPWAKTHSLPFDC